MTSVRTTHTALAAAALPVLAAATYAAPVISTYGPLRNRYMPALSGYGHPDHVALTFDDGPGAASTPHFLDALADRGIHATFFVLGAMAYRSPNLLRDMAAAGHEIAIHGFAHRPHLLRGPRATYNDIARARDTVADVTGIAPRWYRPPYGIATTATHLACRRLGLTPVLWTCWGEDWTARATPHTVARTVTADLRGGGTILLHDCDCTSVPGAWRSALGALPTLLDHCEERRWRVGPLADHGMPSTPASTPSELNGSSPYVRAGFAPAARTPTTAERPAWAEGVDRRGTPG